MSTNPILFSDAIRNIGNALTSSGLSLEQSVVIRDVYGRIRIAIDGDASDYKVVAGNLRNEIEKLGNYSGKGEPKVLFRNDFVNHKLIFESAEIQYLEYSEFDFPIRVLDKQVVGQDWLMPREPGKTPRVVFFGLKGGVGRSTALTILAHHLAKAGKRVLLIDLDLESPGLSSLLLPPESYSDYGLVDWFVEDGVGQGDAVLHKITSSSPMGQSTQGAIRVVSAIGKESGKGEYLSKLSRVYGDVNKNGKIERFSDRVHNLVEILETEEKPDVVLIDSRAGLHDLAAISIVGLSTFTLFFGTGSVQNWMGYELLFSHWKNHPKTLSQIRERFIVIHSLFPKFNQLEKAESFLEDSYTLFSDTIYENIEPRDPSNLDHPELDLKDVFNFDLKDEGAPHYPVRIGWDERFQEFNPMDVSNNIISDAQIEASYGDFLKKISNYLEEIGNASL